MLGIFLDCFHLIYLRSGFPTDSGANHLFRLDSELGDSTVSAPYLQY